MTKDEALKLALETITKVPKLNGVLVKLSDVEAAIKEALAQEALDRKAENARELGLDYEPENTLHWHALNYRTAPTQNAQAMFEALERFVAQPEPEPVAIADGTFNHNCPIGTPLYTAPAHQNVNVDDIGVPVGVGGWLTTTSSQPEHEPVAWMHTKIDGVVVPHRPADLNRHPDRWTALYKDPKPCPTCEALARTVMLDQTSHDATPPQRKPLTEQEIGAILEDINAFVTRLYTFARAIEAAHGIKG